MGNTYTRYKIFFNDDYDDDLFLRYYLKTIINYTHFNHEYVTTANIVDLITLKTIEVIGTNKINGTGFLSKVVGEYRYIIVETNIPPEYIKKTLISEDRGYSHIVWKVSIESDFDEDTPEQKHIDEILNHFKIKKE